jgi:uncharacterized protein (DUF433 family)
MSQPKLDRITQDPNVLDGLPTIRDTGIVVKEVIHQLLNGKTVDEILSEHEELETADVLQALIFTVQSVSALFGGIFFELRNPVNNVKGFADWLLAQKSMPDEETWKAVETIATNARLASDTLSYLYNEYRTQHISP